MGLYAGAFGGSIIALCLAAREAHRWRRALVATGALIGATIVVEWAGFDPGNAVRGASAVPAGIVIGALVSAGISRCVR